MDSLEVRLNRIESALSQNPSVPLALVRPVGMDKLSGVVALLFLLASAYGSYLGLGLPNHPYQWVAGGLFVFFSFQRKWFRHPESWLWILVLVDFYNAASLAKLFIGSGRHFPFEWLRYPDFSWARSGMIPEPTLVWQKFSFAAQEVDLTAVQTFLLGLLVVGRCLRLQAFTSLVAIGLLLASLPALLSFKWDWVFPSLALMGIGFYIQSSDFSLPRKG